ncbi:MATE family efflux transporter [Desulfobulbus sp.]|uniref:MATE family efflux transporter n=1 Tax=Desulfobulbus sp. TaxID=895 RepID=UPI00286F36B7|nr:MATE family efflux transporter [Desulfobulbus sp.]
MIKTFAAHKFLTLIAAGSLAMLVEYLLLLSDSLIAGNMLEERALSAITLSSPVFSFIVFIGFMIAIGTMVVFARQVGRGKRRIADLYFSQGLILVVGAGMLLTAGLLVLFAAVPNWFGVSEEVNGYVRDYMWFMCFLPLPLLLNTYLYDIVMLEGGETLCAASSAVQLAVNIGLSIVLCRVMGIGGISLGTLLTCIVTAGMLGLFFLTKRNTLHFRWFLSLRAAMRVMKFSAVDSSVYLFLAVMQLVMNFFLLQQFGQDAIVIFTVVINTLTLLLAGFDGIGEAIMPLINVYRGEGGQKGIVKTMRVAARAALLEGMGVMVCLWMFADAIPGLFGIETAELTSQAADAVRIFSLAAIPVALILLYTSYYLYIEKIALSLTVTAAYILVFPLVLGIACGLAFGLTSVWCAFAASSFFVLMLGGIYVRWRYREKTFPLLLDEGALARELSYDRPKTKEGIMDLVHAVERDLEANRVDRKKIFKIMLMIEETGMYGLEQGEEKNAVIECTVLLGRSITVILRDSGNRPFVMDEDAAVASFSGYVYTRLLAAQQEKMHMLTSGKNRITYTF